MGMLLKLAADLVRQKRDVIVSLGGDVTPAAQRATRSIPIVMNDAVQAGLGGLARPGSNLTGVALILDTRAGNNCASPESASCGTQSPRIPSSGRTISPPRLWGVQLQSLETRRTADFDTAFQPAGRERGEALIVVSSGLTSLQSQRIVDFTAKRRVPMAGAS